MGKRDRERKERIRAGEEASIATPQPGVLSGDRTFIMTLH
jgi:hypothetical protein